MRWLIRIALTWAVLIPLFYGLGLPYLLGLLSEKSRVIGYADCFSQLKKQKMIDSPLALLKQPEAEHYCHCVSDPLAFTRADLPELLKHQTPERVQKTMTLVAQTCNRELEAHIRDVTEQLPPPRSETNADGTQTIHF